MPVNLSVVLPVYNSANWLQAAIDSVLSQTYADFEFLIIDDGSTDESPKILAGLKDPRIGIHTMEKNMGLIHCLNFGLKIARGRYIARMDADDICHPERFEKQIAFMEQHRDVGICGTQISIIGSDYIHRRPCSDNELRWWIFRGSPFAHPSVLMRTEVIRNNKLSYNPKALVAEDFDLWWRIAFFCRLANLNEELLEYRVHSAQESSERSQVQLSNHRISLIAFLETLKLDHRRYDPDRITAMLSGNLPSDPDNFIWIHRFFSSMKSSQSAISFFGSASLSECESERKKFYLQNLTQFNLKLLPFCFNFSFLKQLSKAGISPLSFILKSILHWKTR